jgi:hypothetical protein
MLIRPATAPDWPGIYRFYKAVMAEGKTYAFPPGQSIDEARPWWMEEPPGRTVPEAFDHPDDGLVGLHVMYQGLT